MLETKGKQVYKVFVVSVENVGRKEKLESLVYESFDVSSSSLQLLEWNESCSCRRDLY